MIEIIGTALNQWDTGRSVSVTGASHVHFANQGDSKAVIMELANSQALIPNYLLQTGKQLCVYAVENGITIETKMFSVKKRERPENYVYEEDQRNYIYELITNAENAVEDATLATKNANEAADKALKAASSWIMVGEASGESIAFDDAVAQPFAGFRIFGKTTQDGTPTPDAPVELVSVGDSITVNVAGKSETQSMTIATPNGLPGIPVTSGGNYTDATGQQWICDEIDLARGVYVQRIGFTDLTNVQWVKNDSGKYFANKDRGLYSPAYRVLCTHINGGSAYDGMRNNEIIFSNDNCDIRLNIVLDDDTVEEVTTIMNGAVLIGVLNSPIETPLSEEELAAYAALHTYRKNTTVSNDASAHMELEYVMDAKKYIDSLVAEPVARLVNVTLLASKWTGENSLYSQVVTIPGITEYSKVDLLPSVEQLAIFHNKDVAFVTENEDGVVTVYAIGDKPLLDYTMQAAITEVEV